MSGETADELRARLGALSGSGFFIAPEFRDALINAWPAIDGMLARLTELEEENDECWADATRLLNERKSADDLARKLATAIGWETEGENWIEKAATKADEIKGMLARLTAAEAELAFLKSEAQADADIATGNFGMSGTIDDLRRLRELGERS